MAFASIIASAIGILLLIITAYVLVAGVLTATQVAMNAQSDMTAIRMQMLATDFTIATPSVESGLEEAPDIITLNLINSGNEPIDLRDLNVFLKVGGSAPTTIPRDSLISVNHWSISPDTIVQWRPTQSLTMSVDYYSKNYPVYIKITTGNGVHRITPPVLAPIPP